MVQPRSIAVAQTCPVPGDVEANLGEHVRLTRIAASEGARIVVFPELSLTGYELGLADDLAFVEGDPRLSPLIETASRSSTTLVVGAPVRLGLRLHIGAFIVGPDGTVAIYTKHRLGAFPASAACDGVVPPAEATVFHPGDRNPLVRFGGNVAAVAVCADVGRASHPREAADRGARTYLASMFVIPSEHEAESAKLRSHAVRHSLTVAQANFGGATGGLASAGRSAIWSGTGELLAQLDASGAGVAVATETGGAWRARTCMVGGGSGDQAARWTAIEARIPTADTG
jgi:predicted amidohydrolase